MKKICYKKWVRALAFLFCLIGINAAILSAVAILCCEEAHVYDVKKEELLEDWRKRVCETYSVQAMKAHIDGDGTKDLEQTNFLYKIIKADSLEEKDYLKKKAEAQSEDFSKYAQDAKQLNVHTFHISDSVKFQITDSVFAPSYYFNEPVKTEESKPIEKVCYAMDTGVFYYQSGNEYFMAEQYGEDPSGYVVTNVSENPDHLTYSWAPEAAWFQLEDRMRFAKDISIVTQSGLEQEGGVTIGPKSWYPSKEFIEYKEYSISQNGYIEVYSEQDAETERYYTLSRAREPLQYNAGFNNQGFFGKWKLWDRQDYFVQAEAVLDFAYAVRYPLFGVCFGSVLCVIVCFLILFKGVGHQNSEEIAGGWIEKIPFDIFCGLTAFLFMLLACELIGIAQWIEGSVSLGVFLAVSGALLALETICLLFLLSVAVRIKLGGIWKTTILCRVVSKALRGFKKAFCAISRSVPILWKAWIGMAALAVLEIFVLGVTAYRPELQILLWFLEKAAVYAFLSVCILQMRALQQAAKRIAEGNAQEKLDVSHMFWELKQHGVHLNHIQDGIQSAVDERMKSERFKTELITNVSHDIKTPLTSIVNYVDLLEKEAIENENAAEYLEVLSRQSARLKKLIEDLMEASKASTGNLTVVFEPCDARVMLVQTIGEFEEKLKAGQIELLVKENGGPFVISADPRHLWRIFENLMNNICKYAQPSTRAYVNIEKSGQDGKIIFRNTSKYALNIESKELLERFVRGDSSRNTEGSGLGLSIAQSLTELMQGKFELAIDGDLFKVTLLFPAVEKEEKN